MLRWRSMRAARVCRSADRIVHVLNGVVRGNRRRVELVGGQRLVEAGLGGQGDGHAELVERALDDDLRREIDVAESLIVAVGSLGGDLAVGVVDVLLVGQQGGAAGRVEKES